MPTEKTLVEVMIGSGSGSDRKKIQPALDVLTRLQIPWCLSIISCHRHGDDLDEHIKKLLFHSKVKFVIAAAGMAADLPGVLAAKLKSHGILVIGVALSSPNFPNAMDALLNIVRMPPGVPLVCSGIDEAGAKNAALFIAETLMGQSNFFKEVQKRSSQDLFGDSFKLSYFYEGETEAKPAQPDAEVYDGENTETTPKEEGTS